MSLSFDKAFARLASLTNWERKKPDPAHRFDLEGMVGLLARIGDPHDHVGQVVQVAGSKGKGTVASFVAGLGRAAGLRTGLYTSPHVFHVLERIQVSGRSIEPSVVAPHVQRVADALVEGQTWFEAFTAVALAAFAAARTELCVLETGLGGRLDSTTVVPKAAGCITGIELEHTRVLGDTIAEVAGEKAGILRPGVPCVSGASGVALEVIRQRAAALGCPLTVVSDAFESCERTQRGHRVRFDLDVTGPVELELPLRARIQVRSFVLALATFALACPEHVPAVLEADLGWVRAALPPGRFDIVATDPPIIVDGAHTHESLLTLAAEVRAAFPGRRFRLVFSIAADKSWQSALGPLAELADTARVAPLSGKESAPLAEMQRVLEQFGVAVQASASVGDAVRAALAERDDNGLLVTGSLYAAGDALRVLRSDGR